MGVREIKKKILDKNIYSLDKLRVEFGMRKEDAQKFMDKLSVRIDVTQWSSNKLSVCHYNYSVAVGKDDSFYIGFEPNWIKRQNDIAFCICEFNPTKVSDPFTGVDCLTFISLYSELKKLSTYRRKALKFDLAIDMPIARDNIQLVKDNRLYEEISNSMSDKTQYLGPRNKHGRVKLYNKTLESKLDIDLTRLELTIDFDKSHIEEVSRLIPKMYFVDNFQFDLNITGTDKVLLIAILGDLSLLNLLSRNKKAKIREYLSQCEYNFELNVVNYNTILEQIKEYVN